MGYDFYSNVVTGGISLVDSAYEAAATRAARFMQSWGAYPGVNLQSEYQPTSKPPAPPGPKTADEMLGWNDELMYRRYQEQMQEWKKTAIPDLPAGNDPNAPPWDPFAMEWWAYAAIGVGVLLILRR